VTQPSRLTFWRIILGILPPVVFFSLAQLWALAAKLNIAPLKSISWLIGLGLLALIGLLSLGLFLLTWSGWREKLFNALEAGEKITGPLRWLAWPALLVALTGSSFIIFHGYYSDLLRSQDWVRLLIFILLALLGMNALKIGWPALSWPAALLVTILLQTATYQILHYLPEISDYPFAMGWSETSRFYWPSLFLSESIYGQRVPWPILHPSLHLTLLPPYLFNAPLWFHRFWQVSIRFVLVALIAPALLSRLKMDSEKRALRWLFGLWIVVYLFTLPLYLHLAVPVFIMLWGFPTDDNDKRRGWIALIAASIWAGLSRLNWYPMPGILAVVLFLMERPWTSLPPQGVDRRPSDLPPSTVHRLRSLIRPLLWFVTSTAIAFATQRIYIALSGIQNAGDFYTSLSSSLLWNRLWPNASYWLGLVPAVVIFSAPLWLVLAISLWQRRGDWHPLRVGLIGLALLGLLAGGILVSLKIGGGADLHNTDAYAILLLIVGAYLLLGRYTTENGEKPVPVRFHWAVAALLVFIPAWFVFQSKGALPAYDPAQAQATLTALQHRVDSVNAQGGEILFITQRHLIAMKMLDHVQLIPEYEREELMEMAMAKNETYLQNFRSQLESHRFAAIIVDPLSINFVGEGDAMGAENDAWTRYVGKRILCTYQQAEIFPADRIAIYVPQEGANQCP
jgi:hypothetical protein